MTGNIVNNQVRRLSSGFQLSQEGVSEEEKDDIIASRKLAHINICLDKNIEPANSSFNKYRLPYKALPEIDLAEVDISTDFWGFKLQAPLVVSSMTGGEKHGRTINENVAKACNAEGVAFGLGSMRIIHPKPEAIHTFDVKEFAPDVPMFANVGLVQLNYGFGAKELLHIVNSVKADGLFVHINCIQEAVQPEGDTNFKDLIPKLAQVIKEIPVPVIVKEVGHGIDFDTAKALRDLGIKMVDVAGVGGSSWAWIEGYRQRSYEEQTNLGFIMRDIGLPSDESIKECKQAGGLKIIAGGGLRNGVDMAKALMLGADYVTCAKPFLAAAMDSEEAVRAVIRRYKQEMRVALFTTGSKNIAELKTKTLRPMPPNFLRE